MWVFGVWGGPPGGRGAEGDRDLAVGALREPSGGRGGEGDRVVGARRRGVGRRRVVDGDAGQRVRGDHGVGRRGRGGVRGRRGRDGVAGGGWVLDAVDD